MEARGHASPLRTYTEDLGMFHSAQSIGEVVFKTILAGFGVGA